jgi:ATP-dependent DNA helicase RecG
MGGIKLDIPLIEISGIGPRFLQRLAKLGVKTVRDLIWHFPARYEDFSHIYKIAELEVGQQATVQGIVKEISLRHSWRRHLAIVEAAIEDGSGKLKIVWFNQPYILNVLRVGRRANFSGKVTYSEENEIYLSHPAYELVGKNETKHTARLVPIYPETRGLTSKGLRFLTQPILKNIETLDEWLPYEILKTNGLPEINAALQKVHFPKKIDEALAAKKRFIFEDLFLLQLINLEQKFRLSKEKAPAIKTDIPTLKKIVEELPFKLTVSQKKSLWEIIQDIEKPRPMNRLLQGDVGSGKTVVAALAALITAQNELGTAFMAPTEVLANQHFGTFKKLFSGIKTANQPVVGLLTSSSAKILYETDLKTEVGREELLKKIKGGEVKIVIGTHALIQKSVSFKNLGLVVVDEQHRFGVRQRAALVGRRQTQTGARTNTDDLLYKDLTYKIRGCLINAKNKIGAGHRENIYQKALAEEFKKSGLQFKHEKTIDINYEGKKIGIYKPDFIVEDKIIVELKALPLMGAVQERQLWKYLKGSTYKLALLANFYGRGVEIKRIIYETARESPRQSALTPHFLSMSATPIPRTLMLTVFGDLDISTITELPAGRKNIVTKIIPPPGRAEAYEFIRGEVKSGRQVFVICPRIEPSDTKNTNASELHEKKQVFGSFGSNSGFSGRLGKLWEVKAVKEEYEKLSKKIFPELKVAMLHGQLKSKDKEKIMKEFTAGKIDILVSTSVVEVGVDVPNATIMMIEGTDRFGLAQLYQFRGRVGRGPDQSYCFLFTDSSARTTKERLKAIVKAKNGFELAEKDLEIRGPGEFLGESQTGFPDTAMQGLQNIELVKQSRAAALNIIQKDRELKYHPLLKQKLAEFQKAIHLE